MVEFLRKVCLCNRFHAEGKAVNLLHCAPCVAFLGAILFCQVYLFVLVVLK